MTSDRERLIDKIRKLRAKGEGHGTTEAEAHAFLDAAAKMMRDHGVDDAEMIKAGIGIEPIEKKGVHTSIHKAHPACVCLEAIGKLTGTSIGLRVTTGTKGGKQREIGALTISGRPQDRQIADYLYDQIRNLIDGAWSVERKNRLDRVAKVLRVKEPHITDVGEILAQTWMRQGMADAGLGIGHKERRSFGFGMGVRLAERIERMATRHADSENALAVWREQTTVSDKKKQTKLDLDLAAYGKGSDVGKTADLGRGVEAGQSDVLRLGKG